MTPLPRVLSIVAPSIHTVLHCASSSFVSRSCWQLKSNRLVLVLDMLRFDGCSIVLLCGNVISSPKYCILVGCAVKRFWILLKKEAVLAR
ncbi:hypothetical protein B0H12DRAFT_633347 [Mycena haematopus]|nr:hypothetical protein B0H12DRAFT_633347 [Mycena haematopus]